MTVFLCLDERGGMMFNNRRQSRDTRVIEDIARTVGDGVLYVSDFSEALFAQSEASVICVPNPLSAAADSSFVFIENEHLKEYADKISSLIIYKWNRHYPSDFKLDISPEDIGLKLSEVSEFAGKSHKKITREAYDR